MLSTAHSPAQQKDTPIQVRSPCPHPQVQLSSGGKPNPFGIRLCVPHPLCTPCSPHSQPHCSFAHPPGKSTFLICPYCSLCSYIINVGCFLFRVSAQKILMSSPDEVPSTSLSLPWHVITSDHSGLIGLFTMHNEGGALFYHPCALKCRDCHEYSPCRLDGWVGE